MAFEVGIKSGDQAQAGDTSLVPLLIGCCAIGVVGGVGGHAYTFEPGADVGATLGGGTVTDATYAFLRETKALARVMPASPTWSAAPSVVKVGSGPTVTCALTDASKGCFDRHTILITIKSAGALGVAQADVAYDGISNTSTITLPSEAPAVLRGSVDIANGADLEGLTLDYSLPTSHVLTFPAGSIAGAVAGLKAATATVAAPLTWTSTDLLAAGLTAIGSHARRLKFTTAGMTPSDAPATVAITGTKGGVVKTETLALAQTSTSVESLKDYDAVTSLVFAAADGTAATIALGYLSAYASPDEIVTEFNTLAVAATEALLARAAQDSSGTYLEVYSTSAGAGVTQTIDPTVTGSACLLLGFIVAVNVTATGAAATLAFPFTNITATFPAGTYPKGATHKMTCSPPRASVSAIIAAATAAHDDYQSNPFGFIVVCQEADTAGNAATLQTALAALTAGWIAAANAPIFVTSVVNSSFHTASQVLATNDSAIAANDAAVQAAMSSQPLNADSMAHDDVYVTGAPNLVPGTFRRPASLAWGIMRALGGSEGKIAGDVGDGVIPGATLVSPDGVTRARDETRAPAKMGRGDGPGFSVLGSVGNSQKTAKFAPGATRAGSTSRLRYVGAYAAGLAAAKAAFKVTELWPAQTPETDPLTGQLADKAKEARRNAIDDAIGPILRPDAPAPPNVSAYTITILNPPTGKFIDNGKGVVKIAYVPLGEFEDVVITITAVGVSVAA